MYDNCTIAGDMQVFLNHEIHNNLEVTEHIGGMVIMLSYV